MHLTILPHQDVSKNMLCTTSSFVTCQWIYISRFNKYSKCCIYDLGPLRDLQYVVLAVYTYMMVVIFLSLCSFNVRRIFLGFTILFVILVSIVFSSRVSQPTYGWPINVLAISWLCDPHRTLCTHPSLVFSGLPFNLKEQSHFLVLVTAFASFFMSIFATPLTTQDEKCLPSRLFSCVWP